MYRVRNSYNQDAVWSQKLSNFFQVGNRIEDVLQRMRHEANVIWAVIIEDFIVERLNTKVLGPSLETCINA